MPSSNAGNSLTLENVFPCLISERRIFYLPSSDNASNVLLQEAHSYTPDIKTRKSWFNQFSTPRDSLNILPFIPVYRIAIFIIPPKRLIVYLYDLYTLSFRMKDSLFRDGDKFQI